MAAVTTKCTECSARLKLRDEKLVGSQLRCPRCQSLFTVKRIASGPPRSEGQRSTSDNSPQSNPTAFPDIKVAPEDRPAAISRKRGRRRRPGLGIVLCLAALVSAGGLWWLLIQGERAEQASDNSQPPVQQTLPAVPDSDVNEPSAEIGDVTAGESGAAISMDYIPVVPQVLLHLRPAEIWGANASCREFVATLGDLGTWLHDVIVRRTRFKPDEIEELTVAINFGARTAPVDVAMVVRLTEPHRESEVLLERINGTLISDLDGEVYESEDLAFMVVDSQTIVVSPVDLAEDLVEAKRFAAVPIAEMESLLQSTDRTRHISLLADLDVFDLHKDLVLIRPLHEIAEAAVLWFGDDSRLLSWSVRLDPHLSVETHVTHSAESTAKQLEQRMQEQLEALPHQLLVAVRQMQPATAGGRKIVGRFPAMVQAFVLGTQVSQTPQGARFTTLLPQIAAANLAAGATLTWNQSARRALTPMSVTGAGSSRSSESVADRLQQPVLVDFRREPLQGALAYICSEIRVTATIDGDALKQEGFTQNMSQTFDLGEVPAMQALDAILQQYDGKMVIVVDEERNAVVLTTREAAEAAGLVILETGQTE